MGVGLTTCICNQLPAHRAPAGLQALAEPQGPGLGGPNLPLN